MASLDRQAERAVERLLLGVTAVDADSARALSDGVVQATPELVVERALDHGVLGLLADAVLEAPRVWPALTREVHPHQHQHLAWTFRLLVELRETIDALNAAGIDYAVVKGPVLAGHAYGSLALRTFSDLDLLVALPDVRPALSALGLPDDEVDSALVREAGQVNAVLRRGTPLDLHWELINDPRVRRAFRFTPTRRRTVTIEGLDVSTLDRTDTLLHLASHTAVSGGHRLGWYADLDRSIRRDGIDDDLVDRAHESGLGSPLAALLLRCAHQLGTPVPAGLVESLSTSRTWLLGARAVDALSPAGAGPQRRVHGQVYFRSTRTSLRDSVREAAALVREPVEPPPIRSLALISLESWDDTWRRNQHLCAELRAQGLVDHITFVEPPRLGQRSRRWSPLPGIDVLRPALAVPKRYKGFATVGAQLRATVLRHADLIWVNAPDLGRHCLPVGKPAVYDVTDDWRAFAQPPHVLARLVAAEDELARRTRTIVCSQVLADRWRSRYGVDAAVVHNGVDLRALAAASPRMLSGPGPHVGYIGTLHSERLDVDLVLELARSVTVHLIGPDHLTDTAALRAAGVVFHGPVPSADVPSWMKAMDVLVSPHRVSDFTLSLDAIKSYEYLATGRPVVATPTSGFQVLQAPALTVVPASGFVAAVLAAVGGSFEPDLSTGWDRRAREFAALLLATR